MRHRRLVNLHRTGRYKGIYHIHGVEQGDRPMTDEEMFQEADIQMLDGKFRLCKLVRSTERTVFYMESE